MQPIRVMIVEDDPMVIEINAEFVSKLPGFVLAGKAGSGKEAMQLLQELHPDLLLLDYFLPDMNGLSLLQWIRSQHYPIDVILLTANRDPEHIQTIFRAGVVDYIIKPFRFERFQSALEKYRETIKLLTDHKPLDQADVDAITGIKPYQSESHSEELLPKGLNDRTLKQILHYLRKQAIPLSSEEVASGTGLSRVTVRRYLDYLEKKGEIKMEVQYGSVGRPMNKYRL
ncbi:response regulator [Neobacillus fumarioli]|uniref:response regulator n=1 Tax=Neobacillus fumarioli TaxID=105229 RepID=UPI00082D0F9B|nr:response regulator [Neobacillus fumarioli]